MIKYALMALALLSSAVFAEDKVVLTEENSISLSYVVTDQSVAALSAALLAKSATAPKDKPLYLVLNTPGGSVPAGNEFITLAKSIPQEVKTISIFSASMGFQIVQNLGERLVMRNSVLMSHLAAGGVDGTIPGSINSRLAMWTTVVTELDKTAASRMKISLNTYKDEIQNELWLYGADNLEAKTADRMIVASCNETLSGTNEQTIQTMFGSVMVTTSKCPLITGILAIKAGPAEQAFDPFKNSLFQKAMFELYSDKVQFTKDYIVTNKFSDLGF